MLDFLIENQPDVLVIYKNHQISAKSLRLILTAQIITKVSSFITNSSHSAKILY